MATIKKYNGSTWENAVVRKFGTATEAVENPLYSDGTAITSYTIKGNTVQSGTPTPSSPVDVQGVGVRTENLAHNWFVNSTTSRYSSILFSAADLKPNTTYVIMFDVENVYNFYSNENVFTSPVYINTVAGTNYIVVTTKSDIDVSTSGQGLNGRWIILKNGREQSVSVAMTNVMIVEGSTPPTSFIPYGYKIPISNGQQTTNLYLGSTQSERIIDKLVLTGGENWEDRPNYTYADRFVLQSTTIPRTSTEICTHFTVEYSSQQTYPYLWVNNGEQIIINYSAKGTTTLAQFKQWLADQYTNGTPVVIYYVLATATTGVVNEPLMKIGDYADTLSNAAQIPTTEGANTITVDTTVQPSEFSATWTGWHNATVKEWDGSQWS